MQKFAPICIHIFENCGMKKKAKNVLFKFIKAILTPNNALIKIKILKNVLNFTRDTTKDRKSPYEITLFNCVKILFNSVIKFFKI